MTRFYCRALFDADKQYDDDDQIKYNNAINKKILKQSATDQEDFSESDEEINTFMQKHWTNIRTFSKKGKVQSIFNFCYNQDLKVLISKIVKQILKS